MFGDQQMHDQKGRPLARRGCGKHDCTDTRALVLQTADGVCADRRCIHGNSYHGGLTPPALCIAMRTSAGIKNDFCDAQTHMHKSGERQPAVVRVTHLQRRAFLSERDARVALARLADADRSGSREGVPLLMCVSDRRVRYVCHGRLTPTAPGARRRSAKNGDIRGTKTHMHKSGVAGDSRSVSYAAPRQVNLNASTSRRLPVAPFGETNGLLD
jgi:hypothetical protein